MKLLITNHNLKLPQGVKVVGVDNDCFILMWYGSKIHIYETSIHERQEGRDVIDRVISTKTEVNLRSCVVDVFMKNDSVFALDENGSFYSLQRTLNSINSMEVEDLFSSPTGNESTSEWKETIIAKVNECDKAKTVCHLSSSIALLAVKNGHLSVLVYSLPEYNLICIQDLKRYSSQDAILSTCVVSLMSPKLKQNFKDNLEPFDEEIIVIGLKSGLLLWFCAKKPFKGPFVLIHTYQDIQCMYWIQDPNSGLYTCLLVLLSSGQMVAFGGEKYSTLCLPDAVKSSCYLKNTIITSNFVDCYASEVQMEENVSVNSVLLPVKGVCAMSKAPGSDVLLAATNHGSVYCFDPTTKPPENCSFFTLPDQSLLDSMFSQSQNLDRLYKQLNLEENILKAVSATVAANSSTNLFQPTVKVDLDGGFTVAAKLVKSKLEFLCGLWSVCVETVNKESNSKEVSFHKMEHDFSSNNDLIVNVNRSLSVDDVVSIELVYFIDNINPLLLVPVGKVVIDACYLMGYQVISSITSKTEESLENILTFENKVAEQSLGECKLTVKIPAEFPVNSVFKTILFSSQQRFTAEEWDTIASGRKLNFSICVCSFPVLLKLEEDSRELTISSNSAKLCHQVKKAVATRLKHTANKQISESLTLDLQAIYQTFEIESLKENPHGEALNSLKKNYRATISAQLSI